MIRVKLLKKTIYGDSGKVVEISRNEAHALIDRGEGVIVVERPKNFYQDKMMRSKRR